MNFSKRNKKVATNRWAREYATQKASVKNNPKSMLLRSALCGFIAGDGSLQIRKEKTFYHYQLDFFPDNQEMLTTYLKFVRYIYNRNPSVAKDNNFFRVRITSKVIVKDLLNYSSFGLTNWNVPHSLFEKKRCKEYWLKAFFSAEGTVDSKRIKIQSINKEGMIKLSQLLTELKIDNKSYTYIPKKTNHQIVYIVMIFRKDAKMIFSKRIGFWHSKKEASLRKSLDL